MACLTFKPPLGGTCLSGPRFGGTRSSRPPRHIGVSNRLHRARQACPSERPLRSAPLHFARRATDKSDVHRSAGLRLGRTLQVTGQFVQEGDFDPGILLPLFWLRFGVDRLVCSGD
jgi:hypothetical protein